MSKTIISFDIGIKNLAYCIFKLSAKSLQIQKWGIANLMSEHMQTTVAATCQQVGAPKRKGAVPPPCTKKATYTDVGGKCWCNVHAKKSGLVMPGEFKLKKLKVDELILFCAQRGIQIAVFDKRAAILEKAESWLIANSLVTIQTPKKTSANQVHLVEIGKQIRTQMDEVLKDIKVDIVILENQISPIAGRMNTIQGMLAQYFIMSYPATEVPSIEFISSAGKLKDFKGKTQDTNTYKDHKRDSIQYCQELMNANSELGAHRDVLLASAKKDDLADCFLQGIYFMKKEKYICCSEDLKINSVFL